MKPDETQFRKCFEELTGHGPFEWQTALWARMVGDEMEDWPRIVSIPTGLGKTAVIAIWLLARRQRLGIPRRLVYVVNRRTVVDQTTNEVEKLRVKLRHDANNAQKFGIEGLAVSTLRGQHADNREWSGDPSRPAVICGTVDMIGSRLLFGGYRIGFRSKPLHAGFLGQDALLVHDEAHLEPAFQQLVERIVTEQNECENTTDLPWPKLHVMALTATAASGTADSTRAAPFELTPEERNPPSELPGSATDPIHHVWKRLSARKALCLHEIADEKKTADKVAELALDHNDADDARGEAVLVFVRTIRAVDDVCKKLSDKKQGVGPDRVQRLTGTMRGYERDRLVQSDPVFARFMHADDRSDDMVAADGTVYLVCTSAGEVGINLSADHMVCDLSTFESMVQRMGRVNRFGDGAARIDVVHPKAIDKKKKLAAARCKTLAILKRLEGDASPRALGDLMRGLSDDERRDAFAPAPTILPASDILFDAWALTTIRDTMPGRPPIAPYLHGIEDWQPLHTSVAWRREVELITDELVERYSGNLPRSLLDDYPLKPHELLSDTSERVCSALNNLLKNLPEDDKNKCRIWIVGERGDVEIDLLEDLLKSKKNAVIERIADCTVLLPPYAGGLTRQGMLEGKAQYDSKIAAEPGYDVADLWRDSDSQDGSDRQPRKRWFSIDRLLDGPDGMTLIRTIDLTPDADEDESGQEDGAAGADADAEAADTDAERSDRTGRFWHWYVRPKDAEDATLASSIPVRWQCHTDDVVRMTKHILNGLDWPEQWAELKRAVTLAAKLHDLGKKREIWQRSIGNPNPTEWYAKPGKPTDGPRWQPQRLSPYRHEFGSLLDVLDENGEYRKELDQLSEDMRDVVLHLIAAHHGYARPHFPPEATVDPKFTQPRCDAAAAEAIRRFARLQRRYGRWGLAYLESLLRAADWAASANPGCTTDSPADVSKETS